MLNIIKEKEFLEAYLIEIWKKKILGEEEYQILKMFTDSDVFKDIFGCSLLTEEKIEQWKKELFWKYSNLEQQCRYRRCKIKSRIWSKLSQYAINEDKYIQGYFQKAVMYLLLGQIFQDKEKVLLEYILPKCVYRKIGKIEHTMLQSFSPVSPIEDLITGNIEKGRLYKRPPKDLRKKEEYNYGEDGKLLLYKHYREFEEKEDTIEFFFYEEEYMLRIEYEIFPEREKNFQIIRIGMQKYNGEIIRRTETAELYPEGIDVFYTEEFEFYEEGLKCINESYQNFFIPEDNFSTMTNRREIYDFKKDKDGYLNGYTVSDWIGDGLIPSERNKHFYRIPERAKEDTQKESGRWRRPVCPDI